MFNFPKDNLPEISIQNLTTRLSTLNKGSISPNIEPIQYYNEKLNCVNIPSKEEISQVSYKDSKLLVANENFIYGENYEKTQRGLDYFKYEEEPSFNEGKVLDKEQNNLIKEGEAYKEVFGNVGLENMNDEESYEKKNEEELQILYGIMGEEKENNKNLEFNESSGKINSSLLNKKRKSSKEKEQNKDDNIEDQKVKKDKNENFILKFLTNSINVDLYRKVFDTLGKIIDVKKCDRKKIKANEKYLSDLLDKTVEELFDLKSKLELIEENIKKFKINKEEEKKMKDLLKLKFKEHLIHYYKSDTLKEFKKKKFKDGKTPEDYDKVFYAGRKGKERGYYLLEKEGFITYAKSQPYCKNERRK